MIAAATVFALPFDPAPAVDWLATFALHSTLALGIAWLACALLRERLPALQEQLLRTSLWVALVSASVQTMLRGSWVPELRLPEADLDAALAAVPAVAVAALPAAPRIEPAWWATLPWTVWPLAAAVAAALGGLLWLAVVHRRLQRVLRARTPETDARVLTAAAEVASAMGLRQSPHVSRSSAIATPIAFGSLRPEICLPTRVAELGDGSLRAMLAHEVAHLRAADPAWMWGAAWLQALFPWQPLYVAVRRRWARLIELRCDAIAAREATPTAVARCLLDVADWLRPGPEASVAALGMAARPSALRERIEAALRGGSFRPLRRSVARAFGGLALGALSLGAPAVATERGEAADAADEVATPRAASATAPASSRVQSVALLAAARTELGQLRAEADRLRSELAQHPFDPQLSELQRAIEARLQAVSRTRARLEELLARTPTESR
jgi:beta-lactamase regulating signal transducer with metallopeptidase domain